MPCNGRITLTHLPVEEELSMQGSDAVNVPRYRQTNECMGVKLNMLWKWTPQVLACAAKLATVLFKTLKKGRVLLERMARSRGFILKMEEHQCQWLHDYVMTYLLYIYPTTFSYYKQRTDCMYNRKVPTRWKCVDSFTNVCAQFLRHGPHHPGLFAKFIISSNIWMLLLIVDVISIWIKKNIHNAIVFTMNFWRIAFKSKEWDLCQEEKPL